MNTKFKGVLLFLSLLIFVINSILAQNPARQMENLDRGLLAVRTKSTEVLISWRILASEFENGSYNVYRGTTLLNSLPITGASNYVDNTSSNSNYSVALVKNGVEQVLSKPVDVWSNIYKKIPLSPPFGGVVPGIATQNNPNPKPVEYEYEANDASVGDLDGDGEYDLVLKWQPTNAKDNSHEGYTGNTFLQGLKMDGTILWTIDLGRNIRSGAHYTQFLVYDLDGDGKAEVSCKTADGTKDSKGVVLGNAEADYRNNHGYVLSGPEYLSLFNGETGAFISTLDYIPARGTVSDWGDNYGNRVDRFLACVAYLDGVKPSVVFARGYYTRTVLAAYDFRDGNFTNRWVFDSNTSGNASYAGQGNHSLTVGDVDADGKDEIQYGSMAVDDDGTGLYTTGFGHGDASHLGDFDPNREGLEYFMVHEEANNPNIPQTDYRDPRTGEVFWKVDGSGDIGRGLIADIDPNHVGAEMWASNGSGIHNLKGEVISTTYPKTAGNGNSYNMLAWYDGDLLRELVDRTVITKWNATTQSTDRVLTAYNYNNVSVDSNNGSKATPCLIADIFGDWREEIIWRKYDNTELVLFSTSKYTDQRIYTLMHDPLYRTSIAWQNVGYNQPAHTGFYLGVGMEIPATPNIYMAGADVLSTDQDSIDNSDLIKLFPNPTSNIINIKGVDKGVIQVYNILGKQILKINASKFKSINLKGNPKGLYLLKITQENKVRTFKVLLK